MIPFSIRILALAVSVAYLIAVLSSVRRSRMTVRQSLLWLLSGTVFICLSLVPEPVMRLAALLGFVAPSNAGFAGWLLIVTALLFYQSVTTSKQSREIKTLCQEIALLRMQQQ
jgi:hypothetical protein